MILSGLPEEVIRSSADFLDTEKDVLAFAQLSRHRHDTLISYLYRHNAKIPDAFASALL